MALKKTNSDRRFVFQARHRSGRKALSVTLTPMIDVTFQLLLYFLLTTTFIAPEKQLMGTVPSPSGRPSILLPIHVVVEPVGASNESAQYQIDDGAPTQDVGEVYAALAGRVQHSGDTEIPVVIHANRDVRWAFVIEVFNAASSSGFTEVVFESASQTAGMQ